MIRPVDANNSLQNGALHGPSLVPAPGNEEAREEEEEEQPYRVLFRPVSSLSQILSRNDPLRMGLTTEEHMWALNIKALVEGLPDLNNLSDLMYVQLALVCRDNVEDAIDRCYALQQFREAYNILNTAEEGCHLLEWLVKLQPENILHFSFSATEGTYIIAHDPDQLNPSILTSPTINEKFFKAAYYKFVTFFPDIESIRRGIIGIAECRNLTTLRREVLKHYSAEFTQLVCFYPFVGKCRCYHTGAMVNIIVSMLRKLLPEDKRDSLQVGFQFDGHMRDSFLTPSVEEANARTVARMQATLKLRYENEKGFSLGESEND